MKIDNDAKVREAARLYQPNKPGTAGGPSFSDFLSQAVEGQTTTQGTRQTKALSASSATSPAAQHPVLDKTSGLVDTLESYGAALANPNLTLKQLEPLTLSLESQAEDLAQSLDAQNADPLDSLAWQAVSQARAEVLKFRRGDYV